MHQNPYQPPSGAASFQANIPTSAGLYEFGPYENAIIEKLAGRIRWWGGLSLAFGSLILLGVLITGISAGAAVMSMQGAVGLLVIGGTIAICVPIVLRFFVTGRLYLRSGTAFREVVQTQGNDVAHVLSALEKMGRAFRIEFWITIVGYGLMLTAIAVLFTVASIAESQI